jgi:hypothetical protein
MGRNCTADTLTNQIEFPFFQKAEIKPHGPPDLPTYTLVGRTCVSLPSVNSLFILQVRPQSGSEPFRTGPKVRSGVQPELNLTRPSAPSIVNALYSHWSDPRPTRALSSLGDRPDFGSISSINADDNFDTNNAVITNSIDRAARSHRIGRLFGRKPSLRTFPPLWRMFPGLRFPRTQTLQLHFSLPTLTPTCPLLPRTPSPYLLTALRPSSGSRTTKRRARANR